MGLWVGERGCEVVVDREEREEDGCCHGGSGGSGGSGGDGGEGATGRGRVIYRGVERSTPWVGGPDWLVEATGRWDPPVHLPIAVTLVDKPCPVGAEKCATGSERNVIYQRAGTRRLMEMTAHIPCPIDKVSDWRNPSCLASLAKSCGIPVPRLNRDKKTRDCMLRWN